MGVKVPWPLVQRSNALLQLRKLWSDTRGCMSVQWVPLRSECTARAAPLRHRTCPRLHGHVWYPRPVPPVACTYPDLHARHRGWRGPVPRLAGKGSEEADIHNFRVVNLRSPNYTATFLDLLKQPARPPPVHVSYGRRPAYGSCCTPCAGPVPSCADHTTLQLRNGLAPPGCPIHPLSACSRCATW